MVLAFIRNPERAPYMGARFGQDVEPAGMYFVKHEGYVPTGWESGIIELASPLFIMVTDDTLVSWKRELSARYENKTGAALSTAILLHGYDSIITHYSDGSFGELIKLKGL